MLLSFQSIIPIITFYRKGRFSLAFVKTVLDGLQRALAKPKKKEHITPAMLKDLVDTAGPLPSLTDARTIAMALTAFSVFLRFEEVVS